MAKALETMSIRNAAISVGLTHMTLRKHYPDLVAPRKRKSPVRMDAPTEEELAIVRRFAADEMASLRECRIAARMSERATFRMTDSTGETRGPPARCPTVPAWIAAKRSACSAEIAAAMAAQWGNLVLAL